MQTWWKTVLTALTKRQNSSKISMDDGSVVKGR